ncbi:MAG: hypothetical protein U0350_32010 [Caldilineaceae bacterium]
MANQLTGIRYTWWRGDPLPLLPPLATFHAERVSDVKLLVQLSQMGLPAVEARMAEGNYSYVAFFQSHAVAYGWSATQREQVGPNLAWPLKPNEHSLWDFNTLYTWRGRGIYPRLLQAILQVEVTEAEHFWIGHEISNTASQRGMLKAGFLPTVEGAQTASGQTRWSIRGDRVRTAADPMVQYFGGLETLCPDNV